MKVLLISFVRGLDPPCGDITYTETLMQHPPKGVEYETYDQAIKRGALVDLRRDSWRQAPFLLLGNKFLNLLRARRWLFWEPYRFFEVREGEYDLVHMHVFSARFLKLPCPLVMSSGAPQPDLYRDRRHYAPGRVARLAKIESWLGKVFGVNCNSFSMPQVSQIMVYTQHYRDYLVKQGFLRDDQVKEVPILSLTQPFEMEPRQPKRIGFVARDFESKGGQVLLEAFRSVRRDHPHVELWIIGSPPQLSIEQRQREGITWIEDVPREELLSTVMPSFDVFAYPTPHDCFSYVVLEAMSCGVAIATSDYVSMPEAVDYGRAGLISPVGDAVGLAQNIAQLLDPEVNLEFRLAAKARFDSYFSWQAVAPRILETYESAIRAHPHSSGDRHSSGEKG